VIASASKKFSVVDAKTSRGSNASTLSKEDGPHVNA